MQCAKNWEQVWPFTLVLRSLEIPPTFPHTPSRPCLEPIFKWFLTIMSPRDRGSWVSTRCWNSFSGFWWLIYTHCWLSAQGNMKLQGRQTVIGKLESLESTFSYWVEICLPIFLPTESGPACWSFRNRIYFRIHVPPFQSFQATAMSVLSLLIWHMPVLSLEGVKRQRPRGVERFTNILPWLSSSWAVWKGFCPYRILTPMCLIIIPLERHEEVVGPERPCEWHDLPN